MYTKYTEVGWTACGDIIRQHPSTSAHMKHSWVGWFEHGMIASLYGVSAFGKLSGLRHFKCKTTEIMHIIHTHRIKEDKEIKFVYS